MQLPACISRMISHGREFTTTNFCESKIEAGVGNGRLGSCLTDVTREGAPGVPFVVFRYDTAQTTAKKLFGEQALHARCVRAGACVS
jgi:hypothetical protein